MRKGENKVVSELLRRVRERFQEYQWKTVLQSYALQSPEERNARLRTILVLSVELDKIRQQDRFSTRLGEIAIEEVIKGDWAGAKMYAALFDFADESEDTRARYVPIWERFRDVLRAAVNDAEMRERGVPGAN